MKTYDEVKLWRVCTPHFTRSLWVNDWGHGEGRTIEEAVRFAIEDSGLEDEIAEYTEGSFPLVFAGHVVDSYDNSAAITPEDIGDDRVLVWLEEGDFAVTTRWVPREPKFGISMEWVRSTKTGEVFHAESFGWSPDEGYIIIGVAHEPASGGLWVTRWTIASEGDLEAAEDPRPKKPAPPVEVMRVERGGSAAILLHREGGGYSLGYEPIMFSRGEHDDIGAVIDTEMQRLRERIALLGELKVKAGAAGKEQAIAAMLFGHDSTEDGQ